MSVKKAAPRFASEAAMCMEFMAAARQREWRASPETEGWDVLVERPDGFQIGVQAKLKANLHVLAQAMEPSRRLAGPACHAVLIPSYYGQETGFTRIALGLGIAVICPYDPWMGTDARPALSWDRAFAVLEQQIETLPQWVHTKPAWMPEVDVLLPGGAPGPQQVTPWKMAACRLSLLLRKQGYLDEADFKAEKQDKRWWVDTGVVRGMKCDGSWRWERPEHARDETMPDRRWPEIAVAIQQGRR